MPDGCIVPDGQTTISISDVEHNIDEFIANLEREKKRRKEVNCL